MGQSVKLVGWLTVYFFFLKVRASDHRRKSNENDVTKY